MKHNPQRLLEVIKSRGELGLTAREALKLSFIYDIKHAWILLSILHIGRKIQSIWSPIKDKNHYSIQEARYWVSIPKELK